MPTRANARGLRFRRQVRLHNPLRPMLRRKVPEVGPRPILALLQPVPRLNGALTHVPVVLHGFWVNTAIAKSAQCGRNCTAAFDTTTFGISLCTPGHQYFVEKSCSTIGSRPVDPPTLSRRSNPEQGFHRSAACVVIERSSAPVKASRMPRLAPPETLAVEVMAKLVAEGAQERTVRGDLFLDGGPHPETDE